MARADLLKQLLRAQRNSDREQFMEAAYAIIDEERRKHHTVLANELLRIINNGVPVASPSLMGAIQPPPRDQERKTPLLEVKHPDRFFRDLILDKHITESLTRVIREFREWDTLEANGLRSIQKILFCGPPGCGKTVTAEAIAGEIGLPLVYVRFDSVVSSLLGETASNLRKVFEYISQDRWVVLFDEFDAIGRSRDDVTEHGEIKRVVNSFLQMLDNFNNYSLVIAATNFEQVLDPALWRRFDEILRFEKPTLDQMTDLIAKKLKPVWNNNISLRNYSKRMDGYSFSDVDRICIEVLKSCALEGQSKFQRRDFETAVERQKLRRQIMEKARPTDSPTVNQQ